METKASDVELIARARAGDLRAFEVLYKKHERPVYRTAVAILGNSQSAEEVLQDCFVRAYKHLGQLNGDPSISPWLHRVAVNLCYSRLRRNYLARLTVSLESLSNHLFPNCGPSPEEDTCRTEVEAAIQHSLASLAVNYRAVIVLHYLQGFSLVEIAYILDCPVGTVKSRLFHARRILGQQLAALRPRLVQEWV